VLGSPVPNSQRKRVVELAVKSRLSAIYPRQEFDGTMFRRAARRTESCPKNRNWRSQVLS
jgi:hypothetical protein